jgi:hypothetical protein
VHLKVFDTRLSQGQLIWVLSHGEFPPLSKARRLAAEIRYLRLLRVPIEEKKRGQGHGNRLTYNFDEFVELCIAIAAMRRGMRPKDVAAFYSENRRNIRSLCRQILEEIPEGALDATMPSSTRRIVIRRADERFLRLHDRYSQTPGRYEVIGPDEAKEFEDVFGKKEVFPDGAVRKLVPLTRILIEVARLAPTAPVVRPGPV